MDKVYHGSSWWWIMDKVPDEWGIKLMLDDWSSWWWMMDEVYGGWCIVFIKEDG